jgi:uncharacterized protein (DUF697 family)
MNDQQLREMVSLMIDAYGLPIESSRASHLVSEVRRLTQEAERLRAIVKTTDVPTLPSPSAPGQT